MNDRFDNIFALAPVMVDTEVRERLSQRLYTIRELMRLTGMTRKQVNYWSHIGLVKPSFRDTNAKNGQPSSFYSASEVIKAFIVCELRRSGFSPRQVEQLALNLHDYGRELFESEVYLLTDGNSVYYARSDTEVVDVLKSRRQMLLLIPLHEHIVKLQEAA